LARDEPAGHKIAKTTPCKVEREPVRSKVIAKVK
jgi:hypothetical protein